MGTIPLLARTRTEDMKRQESVLESLRKDCYWWFLIVHLEEDSEQKLIAGPPGVLFFPLVSLVMS